MMSSAINDIVALFKYKAEGKILIEESECSVVVSFPPFNGILIMIRRF